HNQRGACLAKLRNYRGAADEMRQALRMLPSHVGMKTNLALVTALSGDFDGAEQQLASMPQTNPLTVQVLAYSQIGRGQLKEAVELYRKLATTGAYGTSAAAAGLADLAIYQGRFSEAEQILHKGANDDLAAKNADRAAIKWTSIAYSSLMAGRKREAVSAADK